MLLRHSTGSVQKLLSCGATIEEYTAIQPNGTYYDYRLPNKPEVQVVVVVVDEKVYGVFRITGIEAEGTNYSLASPEYREFDRIRKKPELSARRYSLERIPSVVDGQPVTGWERRQRTPVQRADSGFFFNIEVPEVRQPETAEEVFAHFDAAVQAALQSTTAQRKRQLPAVDAPPSRIEVLTTVFLRNPAVVAEVLLRAKGTCEHCGRPAPFISRAGRPYLEVHHRVPLASGGHDSIPNAEALCPNCHRERHFA